MIVDFEEAAKTARDEPAFSNDMEFARWAFRWCDTCRYDTAHQAEFDPDIVVHPDAPREGCPLLALAVTEQTPAEWVEQPKDSRDRYHCVEWRPNDDTPGSGDPQPVPDPPGQLGLFQRPASRVRMLTQPQNVRAESRRSTS